MKYLSTETIQKARMNPVGTPDALQAAYIDGWNDCVEALVNYVPPQKDDVTVGKISTCFDDMFNDDADDDADAEAFLAEAFLDAMGCGCINKVIDDPGVPDCDDCRISGLLTED